MKPTIGIICLLLAGCGCQSERGFPPTGTIRNFDRVAGNLWRGAQPNAEGFRWLASQGCKTVINLQERGAGLPNEWQAVTNAGIGWYRHEPLPGTSAPNSNAVFSILAEIDGLPQPVFVHCEHGCDRTGMVIACWRIRHGWSNADALREAEEYGLSRWEFGMRRFIKYYGR